MLVRKSKVKLRRKLGKKIDIAQEIKYFNLRRGGVVKMIDLTTVRYRLYRWVIDSCFSNVEKINVFGNFIINWQKSKVNSQRSMAGIYIHIPFCRQACHYCNFYFSTAKMHRVEFTDALLGEIILQKKFLWDKDEVIGSIGDVVENGAYPRIDSIYFGGGTPSLLPVEELKRVLDRLAEYVVFDQNSEITLEANPDDLTREKLMALRLTPVNRLSIGIQSFHSGDLQYMNRVHSPGQAIEAIENAKASGFANLTVDLIYGTPTLSDEQWRENLERVVGMGIPHISAYALTVEKKTALDLMIRRGTASPVNDDQAARQFEIMVDILEGHGYEHYEISNFGKPGFHSRHNLSYWSGKPYLGLGPSAHSYRDGQRWWNVANMKEYLSAVRQGRVPCETEVLSKQQQYDEYVMTSLRTMWGCDLNVVEQLWGKERVALMLEECSAYLGKGWLVIENGKLQLSRAGKLFADRIASDLFWV
jgi:putative oxygen-independent coproporphyrinogen III oxidase